MIEIVPTVVPASLGDIQKARDHYSAFSDTLHIDIADGAFAPNKTWMVENGDMLPNWDGTYHAHLMAEEPRALGLAFVRAGARSIVAHAEAFADSVEAHGAFDMWRSAGAEQVGVGLLYHTPFEVAEPLVTASDFVLLITIERIGTQGIPFAEGAIARVAEFHARFPEALISVDGGVSEKNIQELARAGARRFSVGSAIANSESPIDVYKKLKELAQSAIE